MGSVIEERRFSVSESLLAKVVLYTEGFVIISDREDRIVWANKKFTQRTGYTLNELLGRKAGELFRGPETDHKVAKSIDEALKKGDSYECDILNYTKTKEPFWIHLIMNPVKNTAGKVEHYISIGEDVTESIEKQKKIKEAKDKAEQRAEQKQDIISVLSHDIKSPLNAITGAVDLLEQDDPRDSQLKLLQIVKKSAGNMQSLVENMLKVAKIESNEFPISAKAVNFSDLFKDITGPLTLQAETTGNQLVLDFDENLAGDYLIDPLRFSQVLNNLISNAIKFTVNGTIKVAVNELETTNKGSVIRLEVSDTGRGIAPEAQKNIFSKFKQADASIEDIYGGSGLGLRITEYIVKKMSGDIWLESKLGEGTTFYIQLTLTRVLKRSKK